MAFVVSRDPFLAGLWELRLRTTDGVPAQAKKAEQSDPAIIVMVTLTRFQLFVRARLQ